MGKPGIRIARGMIYWYQLRLLLRINYKKSVLVLAGESEELDDCSILHLGDFMRRKHVDGAIIIYASDREIRVNRENGMERIRKYRISKYRMRLLYDAYCFYKFYDNIVFTYTDTPEDNLLGRYLRETKVNTEDAACLALYHLRRVPKRETVQEKQICMTRNSVK